MKPQAPARHLLGASGGHVVRVEPDGRYWFGGSSGAKYNIHYCIQEYFRTHPFGSTATSKTQELKSAAAGAPAKLGEAGGAAVQAPITVPTWKTGDEWAYRWESPSGKGTFVWEVDDVTSIGGVPHYVLKTGTRRIYHRVDDLALTREELDGRIVRDITPPNWRFLAFPMKVGTEWTMKYHEERPVDRQSEEIERRCTVEGGETISVPAGTFPTLRVTCRNVLNDAWILTIWYSPQVKHVVREEAAVTGGKRIRELITFRHR
jgi:hypothetical protein